LFRHVAFFCFHFCDVRADAESIKDFPPESILTFEGGVVLPIKSFSRPSAPLQLIVVTLPAPASTFCPFLHHNVNIYLSSLLCLSVLSISVSLYLEFTPQLRLCRYSISISVIVLRAEITIPTGDITVFVAHLKSKRPMVEGNRVIFPSPLRDVM
jgi:hypothetical protein